MTAHDLADLLPAGVHEVLLVVDEHPLGEQRSAARDDADEALLDERQVLLEDTCVDGEVVDALLRLVFEGGEDDLLVEILDLAADDHRVDGHGADRDGGVPAERIAAFVEVAAGREVHDRVGAPLLGPLELLDFLVRAGGDGRCAHVGVDLGLGRAADRHRVELVAEVREVRGNDHAAGGDLVADLRRGEVRLALGDALHLGRDDAEARALELGDRGEGLGVDDAAPLVAGVGELDGGVGVAAAVRAGLSPVRGPGLTGGGFGEFDGRPACGEEVPRGLVARRGHPRRVGRAERERAADVGAPRERSRGRALRARRGVVRAVHREVVVERGRVGGGDHRAVLRDGLASRHAGGLDGVSEGMCAMRCAIRFPPPVRAGSGSTGASQRPACAGRAPSERRV